MNIILSNNNLDHCYNKHRLSKEVIQDVIDNADIVSKVGNNIKHYYKDDLCVILCRRNKNEDWYLKTAYVNVKPFILGKIVYSRGTY